MIATKAINTFKTTYHLQKTHSDHCLYIASTSVASGDVGIGKRTRTDEQQVKSVLRMQNSCVIKIGCEKRISKSL